MLVAIVHNQVDRDAPPEDQDLLVEVEAVRGALGRLGHEAVAVPCTLDLAAMARDIARLRPDAVFNLVEGLSGTDALQHLPAAVWEAMGVAYTGNPAAAIVLSVGKLLAKRQMRWASLPTPDWLPDGWADDQPGRAANRGPATGPPESPPGGAPGGAGGRSVGGSAWIIKAVGEHASRGLDEQSIVQPADAAELAERIERREAALGCRCFAERFVEGREFNLSMLGGPAGPEVLPPAEIDFSGFPSEKPRIVGHRAKWDATSFEYHGTPRRFVFPESDRPLLGQLARLATRCWEVFGLAGYARVDFRVDSAGRPWILEVNTNPCLSPDAGFAAAVEQAGLTFDAAIGRILDDALRRAGRAGRPSRAATPPGSSTARPQPGATVQPPCAEGAPAAAEAPPFRQQVRPDDLRDVRAMVESTGMFHAPEVEIAVELVAERLAKGPASGYEFLFAEHEGRPVGYACYGPIPLTADSYDLYWIVVARGRQGQGIGGRLLGEVERRVRAAGGRALYAETSGRADYQPTRAFYERHGYRRAAVLADFYAPGDDKVIYVKPIG